MKEPDVVHMLFGSHLYGLNTPESDKDYKGIYLPSKEELLLGNYPKTINTTTGQMNSRNGSDDVDSEVMALPYFISQACKGETSVMDMLHCDTPLSSSPIWESILENRTKFYSKDMKAYLGYVKKQASKYGLKGSRLACIKSAVERLKELQAEDIECLSRLLPHTTIRSDMLDRISNVLDKLYIGEYAKVVKYTGKGSGAVEQTFYEVNSKKYQSTNTLEYVIEQLEKSYDAFGARAKQAESNDGVDWKALSHALRAGYQVRDIYKHGDFEYPLKESAFLMSVKIGLLDYTTEVAPALESVMDEVDKLAEESSLPNAVDTEYWDKWLLNVYEEYVL